MNDKTVEKLHYLAEVLPAWFKKNARVLPWRSDKEPYHVWLSEIMLQQTRVEAVISYYNRFLAALPDIPSLADADEELLLKLWEGLGYYSRVRNLQKAARLITEKYDGRFPSAYADILSLPGVGPYTAGAIASICFENPVPAVDGNVLRVITRYLEDDSVIDVQATKNAVSSMLAPVYPKGNCGTFTQALMELGACVCIPNGEPKCDVCPIRKNCLSALHGSWEAYPVRAAKKARKKLKKCVLVLNCGKMFAIRKRDSVGLLANLWEFPNADVCGEDDAARLGEAVAFARSLGVSPTDISKEINYTHIFTHVEWDMTAYYISCETQSDALHWVSPDELKTKYALPSAFRPFLDAI